MDTVETKNFIESGQAILGIEFGSTRIKAVLINRNHIPIASGAHDWENRLENGIWTYTLDDIWSGVQKCYADMCDDVYKKYGAKVENLSAIGISAMMHGYMAFDKNDELLVPFRTWRNTITADAASRLTELFNFNIPQRWSIAHLYRAILNGEEHVNSINYLTTLAGYVHFALTGERVIGIGDASGIFPVNSETKDYNSDMINSFDKVISEYNFSWKLSDILPKVLVAGEEAGVLTEKGAGMLDPTGALKPGARFCPPEGDAGTGMTATNSVAKRTGNVSAGTSVFAMVVLEKELSKVYSEIDLVTTPSGETVGMIHCNNCTSDINAWVNMFKEFLTAMGFNADMSMLYKTLFEAALKGEPDCGGLLAYNYFSGEHITGFEEGRPILARTPESKFSFNNFARVCLYSALATLKIGLDIMLNGEGVKLEKMLGHGGFFKTPEVGQRIMGAAIDVPVTVMSTAGEGGAWGIALLAAYVIERKDNESLDMYLDEKVFGTDAGTTIEPREEDVLGFNKFIDRYKKGISIEKTAVESLN